MPATQFSSSGTGAKEQGLPTSTTWAGATGTSREFESEVLSVDPIMGDAILLTVSAPSPIVKRLRPGQFFNITTRFPGSFDPLLRRPYSVYRAHVDTPSLTFLVRAFGRGSAW